MGQKESPLDSGLLSASLKVILKRLTTVAGPSGLMVVLIKADLLLNHCHLCLVDGMLLLYYKNPEGGVYVISSFVVPMNNTVPFDMDGLGSINCCHGIHLPQSSNNG